MIVVKLGGVNGSGKTSVARELLKLTNAAPLAGRTKSNFAYGGKAAEGTPFYILGSYANTCGGMDTISDKEDRFKLVEEFTRKRTPAVVFFEGLITGKTYGALGELSEKHVKSGKADWLYAFMDTPFDVCVQRVLQRRQAAGNDAAFDPERTMRPTYESCVRLQSYLQQEATSRNGPLHPHPTLSLNHKDTPHQLALRVLRRSMEMLYARG